MTSITAFAKTEWPKDTGIEAEAGIVIDADTGAVLFGQNIHNTYPPASITKLLTALVVLENSQLDEVVEYSATALNSVEQGSGNKLSLREGDELTVEDSLYSLLLLSVNQCANGLAEHTAGSMSAFVDMMNDKVAELGLTESHFDNPSGLNGDTQYVSAYDMAMIARAAFDNPELLKISSTINYKIGPTQLFPDGQSFRHEHRLVYTTDETSPYYCPEAIAGKTGYLLAAGNTLVTYGESNGRRVISVILKGKPRQYFVDGKNLLQFGLNRFQNVNIAENESSLGAEEALTIQGVTYRTSDLLIEEDAMITLPNGASFEDADMTIDEELPAAAPIGAVGRLVYTYDDRQVGTAYLMTAEGTPVAVGVHESETEVTEQESTDSTEKSDFHLPQIQLPKIAVITALTAVLVAAILIVVIGGIVWIIYNKKKEAREREARRARRRERLSQESAETQAEYDRIMKERWKR
jgi:D-alanyl-D-alanine carboxypeptidase